MKTIWLMGTMALAGCGMTTGGSELQVGSDDVGTEDECDGGLHDGDDDGCGGAEPDLPYDVKIQCGDEVIPVVAAFREKNGADVRFAPAPGSTAECPFVIEGAVIHADEVASCQPFTATEADAAAAGNRDAGRDRVEVTWCWYTSATDTACETDHLDIRFSCDGGEGVPDGAAEPLGPDATTNTCDDGGGDDGAGDDGCTDCPDDGTGGGGDGTVDPVD
ncbi:MAG TPA: hypothetical protein VMZ28_25760 [Kofleriaceae bacterium]|nr:hypothetical protein [Kofleriaceae bacterium]